MSQFETQILHQDYVLTCPDGQEPQLLEAVERVEQQFEQMRVKSKLRSRERIGVLLAVNLAYENLELRKQLQALQEQLAHAQSTHSQEDADTDTNVAGIDAERIEQLEHIAAQYATDLVMAQELIQRLDDVLMQPSTAQTAAQEVEPKQATAIHVDAAAVQTESQLATTASNTQENSATSMSAAALPADTVLDNPSDMDLRHDSAETR